MKKILVTTDFSANSKAALRFAIQLASQHDFALTFLHVHNVMRPTSWNKATYAAYEKGEMAKIRKTLDRFVKSVYKSLKISTSDHPCAIENSVFPEIAIISYATDHAFDFVCVSTRGAGTFEKLFGTTTAHLINHSPVPVIAVPGSYRVAKLTSILYASDLSSLEPQIKQVVDFAGPLAATVELLHFSVPTEPITDPEIIKMAVRKFSDYPIDVHLKPLDPAIPLIANLESAIETSKPSMLMMFTKQNQGFFHRLFPSSNSIDYALLATVPLLVFSKAYAGFRGIDE
ncbi:MAG: universal stress protein [Rudanella sp.]|nr:universal stress protein [Rudanella sp.]